MAAIRATPGGANCVRMGRKRRIALLDEGSDLPCGQTPFLALARGQRLDTVLERAAFAGLRAHKLFALITVAPDRVERFPFVLLAHQPRPPGQDIEHPAQATA